MPKPSALARELLLGAQRTVVPFVVAWLLGLPIASALGVTTEQATTAVSGAVGFMFWLIIRGLELWVDPRFSLLLGSRLSPVYGRVVKGEVVSVANIPHAATLTASGPAPAAPLLRYFDASHLPAGPMRSVSERVGALAADVAKDLPPGPETTTGLRKLLEAKDALVRAAIDSH